MSSEQTWQFWIDVGGTFTDCLAQSPEGQLRRHKLLSSGAAPGVVAAGSNRSRIVDPARRGDPPDFWRTWRLSLRRSGESLGKPQSIAAFDSATGTLTLAAPLDGEPRPGDGYLLTSDREAPVIAAHHILGIPLDEPLPPLLMRLGATRGTNALLTRTGARTAFVTTRGFGDILEIGYQDRPRLFDLAIEKRVALYEAVVEVDERISADGQVLLAPRPAAVLASLERLRERGIESLAICLLNAYAHPQHEEIVERLARQVGFQEISTSSRAAPLVKLVSRGDTTVADAYLNPVLRSYTGRIAGALAPRANAPDDDSPADGDSPLRVLTSAGNLARAADFRGKDSLLSGPAGGVIGFSRTALAAGFEKSIGFDMGGTSTDVSRFDGQYEYQYETEKAGVRIVSPMLAIETVAAGGGSICRFDGVKLVVGPKSAGADPGPACYGGGGPLTVTDINLLLGKILPDQFPFPLDGEASQQRLAEVTHQVAAAHGRSFTEQEVAAGLLAIANANMAAAIRSISVAKGYDPRDYVLVSFGGAAPQHACGVADLLGIERILNHPDGGILSAVGIGMAEVARHRVEGVYRRWTPTLLNELESLLATLADQARQEVQREGVPPAQIVVRQRLDLRYEGIEQSITVAQPEDNDYAAAYEVEHQRLYGYRQEGRPVEVVAARIEAVGQSARRLPPAAPVETYEPQPVGETSIYFDGAEGPAKRFRRADLKPGAVINGPAIIAESVSTTVIDPGWRGQVLSDGQLLLARTDADRGAARESGGSASRPAAGATDPNEADPNEADPAELELFNNRFAAIAEQMGIALRNTASSVNVKERLDFSCAIFTPEGELVVNAPHIPVHLGAMSETVKCLLGDRADMQPGDVFLTNDPYRGGSHLPDLTVITPVFGDWEGEALAEPGTGRASGAPAESPLDSRLRGDDDQESGPPPELLFFTASRAHHAEIGGITPGSMPPHSTNLAEEGVLVRQFKVLEAGQSRFDQLAALLTSAPYPTRAVEDNLADIAAQIAANRRGAADLQTLLAQHGAPVVRAYMRHIQTAAEKKTRAALARLGDGRRQFTDYLDDGSPISVTIDITGETAVFDFAGTGSVLSGNLNANRAIVTAAVLYCLRLLIDEDIPLNEGVLAPVEIRLPECLLNPPAADNPAQCAAVAGGNVETSQRVVDVLLGALGLAAASQGTMNNVLFGDESFGYYETICGGAGATRERPGASAVHTHMTNTRLTDPEVFEQRLPARVLEFAIRRGSGGDGLQPGGDGVRRRIEFLKTLDVSILSQRRGNYPPFGLHGGGSGAIGHNWLERVGGEQEPGRGERAAGDGVREGEAPAEPGTGRASRTHAEPPLDSRPRGHDDQESGPPPSAICSPPRPGARSARPQPPNRFPLPGITQFKVNLGDVLTVETPGGGGFGSP